MGALGYWRLFAFFQTKFPKVYMQSSKNILRFNCFNGFKLIRKKNDFRELFFRVKLNPLKLLYLKMFLVHGCIKDFGNFMLKKNQAKMLISSPQMQISRGPQHQ